MTHENGDNFYLEKNPTETYNDNDPTSFYAADIKGGLKKLDADYVLNYIDRIDKGENVYKDNNSTQS